MAFVLVFTASQTTAQNGARYPESFQIKKNGTTVLLEDYASAPRSAPAFAGVSAPPNDFEGLPYQLARVNVLTVSLSRYDCRRRSRRTRSADLPGGSIQPPRRRLDR